MIPAVQHPDRPKNPPRLRAQFTDKPAGHSLRYGCLLPIYVYSDGVDPRGVHCLLYLWILPLSDGPTFCRHIRDPSRRPMVKCRQDLEHLPSHHLTLASIE